MKRIFSIILALSLVLCALPATAMADDTSQVTSIDATVTPILGAKIGTYGSNIAATHVKGFTATPTDRTKGGLILYDVIWHKISDADYTGVVADDEAKMALVTDENEVFQDGYHYYVIAQFADYDDATVSYLPFADTVTGTINGETASSVLLGGNLILSVAAYVDVSGFYDIDMTIAAPALGAAADYEPTYVVTDDLYEDKYELGETSVETIWYKVGKDSYKGVDDSAWVEMEEGEEYATGYYYMAKFEVLEYNNPAYDWLFRTISTELTGSLNGEDFDKIVVADDQYHAQLYKCFEPLAEKKADDPATTPASAASTDNTNYPKTADSNVSLGLVLLFVGGGAIAATALASRKRKYSK